MLFLIEYDPQSGKTVTFRTFDASDQAAAENARLDLELRLSRAAIDHEVVILQAASEEAIRRTHRRYFEDLHELTSRMPGLDSIHSR